MPWTPGAGPLIIEPVRYRLFGCSGLRVSELFLGTTTFGQDWGWGGLDKAGAITLRFPHDFIRETADLVYGPVGRHVLPPRIRP